MSPNTTRSTVSPKSVYSAANSSNVKVNEIAKVSAADDNNVQKQQAPEAIADASTANDKPPKMLNESTCISIPPINEFTIGLKRTSSNENVVGDKIKKCRLNKSDEEIEIPSLINSNNLKDKDHIEVLNGRLKSINTIKELCVLKKVYDPSVSNEISKENSVTDVPDNQNPGATINISTVNHNVCSPSETSKEVRNANKSSNLINEMHIAQIQLFGDQGILDSDEEIEIISQLNSSSCSDRLVIVETSDTEDDADKDFESTDNSKKRSYTKKSNADKFGWCTNISANTLLKLSRMPAIQDILSKQFQSSLRTKNQNGSHSTMEEDDYSDTDFEAIDIESNSNAAADENDVEFDEGVVNKILDGISKMTDNEFPEILKYFNKKELNFDQFESICTKKMLEVLTEKIGESNNRKELQQIMEREKFWRTKYNSLNKQCKELKAVITMHNNDLKTNPDARPHIVTRTVGLQAVLLPKKDSSVQSSKVNNATTSIQQHKQPVAIDITGDDDDDDDDVIALDTITDPKPSCSKTVECSTNTTPIKKKPSISNILPINTPVKSVPPAVPIVNNDNTCTIDLTDDDVIEVSNGVSLDKPPIKIVRHSTIGAGVPPGTVPAQLTGKPQMLQKNITYIEIPNLSNCNSSYIVRPASTTGNTQIENATSLSPINRDPSKGPILYKGEKYIPVQLGTVIASKLVQQPVPVGSTLKSIHVKQHRSIKPVVKSVQPGVSYTTHKLSTSQSNGSLQPVPPAIPIIYKHPAPLPPHPVQRNVPTWKKIPPAPKLTATISSEGSYPKALVLSWNLSINKTHAEISAYQIFAYKEPASGVPKTEFWKEIGNVTALPLPMACSLTKFIVGEKYHFAVRAKDVYCRVGPFSAPDNVFMPIN